jgi:hypothetical protein
MIGGKSTTGDIDLQIRMACGLPLQMSRIPASVENPMKLVYVIKKTGD